MSKETDAAKVLSEMSQLVGVPLDLSLSINHVDILSPAEDDVLLDEDAIGATCTLQPSCLDSDMLFSLPEEHGFLSSRSAHNDDYISFDDAEHPYAAHIFAETCNTIPKQKSIMEEHQPKNKSKCLKCFDCGKSFKTNYSLKVHLKFHSGEKPFSCEKCDKAFTTKSDLRRHEKVHVKNENSYQCGICSKTFRDQATLTRHLKIHNAVGLFTCIYCKKDFSRVDSYKVHMNMHNQVKCFKCTWCSSKFNYKSSYNRHLKTHNPNTLLSCKVCGKSFQRSDCLRVHMRVKHPKKTFDSHAHQTLYSEVTSFKLINGKNQSNVPSLLSMAEFAAKIKKGAKHLTKQLDSELVAFMSDSSEEEIFSSGV